jgi:AcrR family transcriptional regulator
MPSAPARNRRERNKTALRGKILTAARHLFAKEGYDNVSMRKIAQKIGYTPTTIYLYFRDKDELVAEICNEMFAALSAELNALALGEGNPVEKLKAGLRAYIDFGIAHPEHYRVSLMTPFAAEPECMGESEGLKAFGYLVGGVTRCIQEGHFIAADIATVSQSMWMTIHGAVSLLITHEDCFPWVEKNQLITVTIDSCVRGFLR